MHGLRPALAALLLAAACAAPEKGDEGEAGPVAAGEAVYLGNEGVLVVSGGTKLLFDPLYGNTFGQYQAVPEDMRAAILSAAPPFEGVDAVLISHAHADHFDAADLIAFHAAHPDALIIAPPQAHDAILATGAAPDGMADRFVTMGLDYGTDPLVVAFEGLTVEAVRIPHSGGEARRGIENLAYRVTLGGRATVLHMGDADPAAPDFADYDAHWQARQTDLAFPPYWFALSTSGQAVLSDRLNARAWVGVHVPQTVPADLEASGADYFHMPGERREILSD